MKLMVSRRLTIASYNLVGFNGVRRVKTQENGGSSTSEMVRTVGFYNSGGTITTIKFDDLKQAIKKMNK